MSLRDRVSKLPRIVISSRNVNGKCRANRSMVSQSPYASPSEKAKIAIERYVKRAGFSKVYAKPRRRCRFVNLLSKTMRYNAYPDSLGP